MNDRREILRTGLRCGGLLALGGVASVLGWRSLHGNCVRSHPCDACPLLSGCELPKAVSTKTPAPEKSVPKSSPNHAGRPI